MQNTYSNFFSFECSKHTIVLTAVYERFF